MVVTVNNLVFNYDKDGAPLLHIPAWRVDAGEQVFLHGPSGCGKTTLLNLLAGILLPHHGKIEILGQPINTLSGAKRDKWRAKHIGVVFQAFNLIPYLDAVDNIKLAAHFGKDGNAEQGAHALLESLGIDEELRRRRAETLSIGQQQRVAIARALINRPELLIVDEPTSALDSKNRDAFMSLLMDNVARTQTALVFVSHDLNLSSSFSRVDALEDINIAKGGR